MSLHFQSGRFSFGSTQPSNRPDPGKPFKILVISDFSGRESRGVAEPIAGRRAKKVDIDTYDDLMESLSIDLRIPVGDAGDLALSFKEFDDFEPDAIFRSSPVFAQLRGLRKQLKDPATFADAAAVVQGWSGTAAAESPSAAPPEHSDEDDDDLARLLGRSAGQARPAAPVTAADELIKSIVGPYVVPSPDPRVDQLLESVDRAIANQMRTILHHPRFKALECAWRGLHMLITGLETSETLEVWTLDASSLECAADLAAEDPTTQSGLYDAIVRRPVEVAGGAGYAVVLVDHLFHPTVASATLLGLFGGVGRAGGASVFAAGSHRLIGAEHLAVTPEPAQWTWSMPTEAADAWAQLREHDVAGSVAVFVPRVLMRLPYGPDTSPVDSFEFDEFAGYSDAGTASGTSGSGTGSQGPHEAYLWGSGGWLGALVLGQAFTDAGWSLSFHGAADAGGMPMHTWRDSGESHSQPIAEAWLTDRATGTISERGMTPLTSIQHRDAVRVGPIRSLSKDGRLQGR